MHNAVSLDGSFTGFDVDMGLHYQIAGRYQADAHLIGSNTVRTGVEMLDGGIPPERESDLAKPQRATDLPYWVIVDTKGVAKGLLHTCRSFEFCRDVIVLISPGTDREYVNYLKDRNYDYLICGDEHANFQQAFEILAREYGVKTILVDSGPTLNSVLLGMGLIDEISLLVVPVLVGRKSGDLLSNLNMHHQNVRLKTLSSEDLDGGTVLLRYEVLKEPAR